MSDLPEEMFKKRNTLTNEMYKKSFEGTAYFLGIMMLIVNFKRKEINWKKEGSFFLQTRTWRFKKAPATPGSTWS